ncbi:MAG: SpoIIE family protein phosphatase [Candidatus Methanofastidiosia archaeon]
MIIKPLIRHCECGDTGIVKEFDNKIFIGIVDILGHGRDAYKLAIVCKDFIERNYEKDLIEIVKELHDHLLGSRGAVMGLCNVNLKSGNVEYVGVGDTTIRKFGSEYTRLVSVPGVVGYLLSSLTKRTMKLSAGDVLVLYTDGVKEHFEIEDYPRLLNDDAKTIAKNIIRKFGKKNDDASCIVLRYE